MIAHGIQRLRSRSRECAIYRHFATEIISPRRWYKGDGASVNYRRRAGNLIDRDKRSNCVGGRAAPSAAIFFIATASARSIFDIMFTEPSARCESRAASVSRLGSGKARPRVVDIFRY